MNIYNRVAMTTTSLSQTGCDISDDVIDLGAAGGDDDNIYEPLSDVDHEDESK